MKKLIKRLLRFLWPAKKKRGGYKTSFEEKLCASSQKQIKDGLDEITPQCRSIIQGTFDRVYGPGTVEPVYVSREALNKPLTVDMALAPGLPKCCPRCSGPLMLSKKDNRVCACRPCSVMYLTAAANEDPNICADIVHCKAGIKLEPITEEDVQK